MVWRNFRILFLLMIILFFSNFSAQDTFLQFNRLNKFSYVDCSYSQKFFPEEFTIEAWIYPNPRINGYLLSTEGWTSDGASGYVLRLDDEQGLDFTLGFGNNGWIGISSGKGSIPVLRWTHIAVTYVNCELKLYINGGLKSSLNTNRNYLPSQQKLIIGEGSIWKDRRFSGKIYDVRFWDSERTETQIQNNKDNTLTGSEENLISNWQMNNVQGNTIKDATGNFDAIKGTDVKIVDNLPIIASNQQIAISPSEENSFLLKVKNTDVIEWDLINTGSNGNTYIKSINRDSIWLSYTANSTSFKVDNISLSATSFDGAKDTFQLELFGTNSKYFLEAERILDKIEMDFINPEYNFFAETIYENGLIDNDNNGHCYLWPACHILRTYNYAYKIFPQKYLDKLSYYIFYTDNYETTNLFGITGYAASQNGGDRFYDDVGWLMIQFYLAYKNLGEAELLDRMHTAYEFNNSIRDENWGIPFNESMLDIGMFYTVSVAPTALGSTYLFKETEDSTFLNEAKNYYDRLNDESVLVKDAQEKLFNQYSFFVDGNWTYNLDFQGENLRGHGFRAYQTAIVIQLAIELYKVTGQSRYLEDAQFYAQKCLDRWYVPNGGIAEIGFWGGNDLLDALLDLYDVDQDEVWLNAARNFVDYLIEYGKDKHGYYASSYNNDDGFWNLDRRDVEPETILFMGQAVAASALFRLASYDSGVMTSINNDQKIDVFNKFELHQNYPNPFNSETVIKYELPNSEIVSLKIYNTLGQLVKTIFNEHQTAGVHSIKINVNDIASGVYYYQLKISQYVEAKKMILIK